MVVEEIGLADDAAAAGADTVDNEDGGLRDVELAAVERWAEPPEPQAFLGGLSSVLGDVEFLLECLANVSEPRRPVDLKKGLGSSVGRGAATVEATSAA